MQDDGERKTESQRILDRIAKELHLGTARTSAEQKAVDQSIDDPIEYWGTRIGRGLGLVITILIVGWLALYVFAII